MNKGPAWAASLFLAASLTLSGCSFFEEAKEEEQQEEDELVEQGEGTDRSSYHGYHSGVPYYYRGGSRSGGSLADSSATSGAGISQGKGGIGSHAVSSGGG